MALQTTASHADNTSAPPATTNPAAIGLTLEELATAKGLDVNFLKQMGVSTMPYQGAKAVRISYCDGQGAVLGTRYRTALDGKQRFRWKSGDHVQLYGMPWLDHARKQGWVLVVEGESDCWTAWSHGLPAVGVPGKSTWRTEWAPLLGGLDVYVWEEPEAESFTRLIAQDILDAKVIIAPDGLKDISEAHVAGIEVVSWLADLRASATPVAAILDEERSTAIAEAKLASGSVLDEQDILARVERSVRAMGFGGDAGPVKLSYLSATSRLLQGDEGSILPHVLLLGPPSAGKSFIQRAVVAHLPDEAVHVIDAGSPRALIYDGADLRHKLLVFGEADSLPAGEDNPAASAIRNLLQDGNLHYDVVERDPTTGQQGVRHIEKHGPTVLLTTST